MGVLDSQLSVKILAISQLSVKMFSHFSVISYQLKFWSFLSYQLILTDLSSYWLEFWSVSQLRPSSDAVLHMSRIEFDELSSCEVRRLNQFETAD